MYERVRSNGSTNGLGTYRSSYLLCYILGLGHLARYRDSLMIEGAAVMLVGILVGFVLRALTEGEEE